MTKRLSGLFGEKHTSLMIFAVRNLKKTLPFGWYVSLTSPAPGLCCSDGAKKVSLLVVADALASFSQIIFPDTSYGSIAL